MPARFPSAPLVTVFGGTGFLGRRIVASLLGRGARVRIAARHPHRPGMPSSDVQYLIANVTDLASIEAAIIPAGRGDSSAVGRVGALIRARVVNDPVLSNEILSSVRESLAAA